MTTDDPLLYTRAAVRSKNAGFPDPELSWTSFPPGRGSIPGYRTVQPETAGYSWYSCGMDNRQDASRLREVRRGSPSPKKILGGTELVLSGDANPKPQQMVWVCLFTCF